MMGVASLVNGFCNVLILASIFTMNVAGKYHIEDENRTCILAEAKPTLNSSSCYPLVNFSRPACKNRGITLPSYVYGTPYYQNDRNDEGNRDWDLLVKIGLSRISYFSKVDINIFRKCLQAVVIWFCRQYFPSCDGTQNVFKKQKICRESCLALTHTCGKLWKIFIKYYTVEHPDSKKLYLCELQPYRNAGDSPECWYFNELANSTDTLLAPEWTTNADCMYLNGSSYQGNISMTASGIPCQSWTEQCPHRHTMNNTYPELNKAENYCRNPQNSGQRPWCFTTDRKKRWEYCDIPKCIPVDGGYGNWSLNITCNNVTCDESFATWTRECNNPEPKYGGKNCSHLGEPVEYRPCSPKLCPVNGGYSNWTLNVPCNVSCGDGVEIWRRFCNNPKPKYGGHNCSNLGNSTEFRHCTKKTCPIDGIYSNWTTSPCSATCGQGVEIRTRQCDNPPGKYGGNCSKQGPAQEIRACEIKPCPGNNDLARSAKSLCTPAEKEPVYTTRGDCQPLIQLDKPFCKHYGYKLDKYVNVSLQTQQFWDNVLWQKQEQYDRILFIGKNISTSPECLEQARFIACYYTFPGCDRSTSEFRPKKFCKEFCIHFTNQCSTFFKAWKNILLSAYPAEAPFFSCLEKPSRNAGDSPECLYYNKKESIEKEDCLYLNGSSYYGNISVTASGIPCQSWTEQCPHRHTMNETYPELNNAKNHCRNPRNSGQRPWCFTTDRKKRWEYCDISKCIPVDGNYGNWSLNRTCNVTCGEGFETWSRECNNPLPKFGGRNCRHLGKPVEYRPCTKKPCAVNGGYSTWYLSSQCNVTCGQGEEIWQRSCDNPTPKNEGRNCSVLGENIKRVICERRPCPIHGNYSNWTTSSACSVTCGVGYQIWFRKCDNPSPAYGGKDCSKYGKDKDSRPCRLSPCSVTSRSAKEITIACCACASIIIMAIGCILIRKRNVLIKRFKRGDRENLYEEITDDNIYEEITDSVRESNSRTEEHIYESVTL